MQSVSSTINAGDDGSHALYPRASKVLRIPPFGKEEASGLLLYQQFACELFHHAPFAVMFDESVMLFCRTFGERCNQWYNE